jgi:oligopeptidase B
MQRTSPPVAAQVPVITEVLGHRRTDEYAWLRDKENPAVLEHLRAENAFTDAVMAPTASLQATLFEEMKSRIQETDASVPVVKGPFAYVTRTEEGLQYAIHTRIDAAAAAVVPNVDVAKGSVGTTSGGANAEETILLDENALAEGHEYFALGTFEVSPNHHLVAYATDTDGDEVYELRVKDLRTGHDLGDVIEETAPGCVWSDDSSALLYTTLDDAMRPWQVWSHRLGTDSAADELVFQEDDERFYVGIGLSATDTYAFVEVGSQITTELHVVPRAAIGTAAFALRCLAPREQGVEYDVDHHVGVDGTERWIATSNHGDATNFRLFDAPLSATSRNQWRDLGLHADAANDGYGAVKLDGVDVFRKHLALTERADGLERIRLVELSDSGEVVRANVLPMPEPVYSVWTAANVDVDCPYLRFGYTSPTTPASVFDFDLASGVTELRKRQAVLGDFDPARYTCERTWATAADGTSVPISLVRRNDTPVDGTAPGVLYGYGAYEISTDPTFSVFRLSLLDRGWVFAMAHVRGGGEMGRRWYLDGKFEKKSNTFSDFVACADHLVANGWIAPDRVCARGGSAGGLLMGAVINLAPQRFRAVLAEVPFVDVVNTMLDASLPLTAIEWEEWGNPAEPDFYDVMTAYAPYDNLAATAYPDILATAGLNDPRVGFWEPAKWIARIRSVATNTSRLLLRTELGAGHGGPSGRYAVWRDEAFSLAFLISAVTPAEQLEGK